MIAYTMAGLIQMVDSYAVMINAAHLLDIQCTKLSNS